MQALGQVVEFDAGYLPAIDGCVIGSRVTHTNAANGLPYVPVVVVGGGASAINAQLPLCNDAIREGLVSQFNLDRSGPLYTDIVRDPVTGDYISGGVPNLITNPAVALLDADTLKRVCPSGGTQTIFTRPGQPGSPTSGVLIFRWCNSALTRLQDLPLIHPTAGCIDSDVWWEARGTEIDPANAKAIAADRDASAVAADCGSVLGFGVVVYCRAGADAARPVGWD